MPTFQSRRGSRGQNLQNQAQQQEEFHQMYQKMLEEEQVAAQRKKTGFGWKIVKQGWDGIVNVARSMNTPNTNRRPKISQMPGHRSDIEISRTADLRHIVDPALRGRDIRGKRVDPKDFYRRRRELM